jgi:hypothetical protein
MERHVENTKWTAQNCRQQDHPLIATNAYYMCTNNKDKDYANGWTCAACNTESTDCSVQFYRCNMGCKYEANVGEENYLCHNIDFCQACFETFEKKARKLQTVVGTFLADPPTRAVPAGSQVVVGAVTESKTIDVAVPANAGPGTIVQIEHEGRTLQIEVPQGCFAGSIFKAQV